MRGLTLGDPALLGGLKAFSPLDLSPILWLDASDASTFTYSSGSSVSQWSSKVGSYAFTQATATKQPSRSATVNGLSAVSFDGTDDSMASSTTVDMSGGQKFSIWCVISFTTGATQIVLEHSTNFNNNAGAFLFRGTTLSEMLLNKMGADGLGGFTYASFLTTGTVTTTPKSVIGTHDGTLSTNETTLWINGTSAGTRSLNNNTNSDNANQTMYLGARDNSASFMSGTLCEIGITTTALTAQNISDLHTYLAAKWAL